MRIRHQSIKNTKMFIGSEEVHLDENGEADVSQEVHDSVAGKYGYESLEVTEGAGEKPAPEVPEITEEHASKSKAPKGAAASKRKPKSA